MANPLILLMFALVATGVELRVNRLIFSRVATPQETRVCLNKRHLVVTKLDRLGRNAMDVRATVEQLANSSIHVHCLAFGGVNLTSPAGK